MILTDDEPRSTMYGSGRERGGHSTAGQPGCAAATRTTTTTVPQAMQNQPALECRPGEVGDATIPQPSVPAVEPTLLPQYRLFTLIYAKYRACSWVYV